MSNLSDISKDKIDPVNAIDYIRQVSIALQHLH